MSDSPTTPESPAPTERIRRPRRSLPTPQTTLFTAHAIALDAPLRQAELFYLQKQIQAQTPMVIVLEDGTQVEGCIEWYDRSALKVRGKTRTLVYKHAIKYMYKMGE
ncbi:RNA chaperone Hfq [Telmatobacter bradus]|uniref:RNA chaperone Hfq n=1 Tax=Telmatobacter bradus TaxID=474953 RepID=UPI003B435B68